MLHLFQNFVTGTCLLQHWSTAACRRVWSADDTGARCELIVSHCPHSFTGCLYIGWSSLSDCDRYIHQKAAAARMWSLTPRCPQS
jgi:hypothetical protein